MLLTARVAVAVSGATLLALGLAYSLTYEPAPEIRILWRADLDPARRTELERTFLLVNSNPFADRLSYDLLDTIPGNVEALVNERDILDTDRVDRVGFTIPSDIPYGSSWMWIANRTPVLRIPGLVRTVVLACATALAASLGVLLVARRTSRTSDRARP